MLRVFKLVTWWHLRLSYIDQISGHPSSLKGTMLPGHRDAGYPFRENTHTQFMIQGSTRSVSQEKNQKSHGNAEEEDGVPAWGKQSRYYIKTMMFSSALMRKVFSMIQGLKDFSPILNSCSIDGLHYLLLPLMMMMIRNWLCLLSTHYMPETFMIMNTLYILIHLTLTSA